ncbi:minichromosome maintenance 5 protein [Artemisia annua]|uniref:Minichromosome maintenance 5 protein n=1 Tax=Artemisia annua TaxID=35608 RepID=A0A2U1L560_ARTAN|nr:minichromosome maintenance 5 protein [Artemisia annua]
MEEEFGLRKIEHEVLIAFLENILVDNALDTYLVHHRYPALIDSNHRRCSKSHNLGVLLLVDLGTAKSHSVKYVEKPEQRSVYTTGKAASSVGLTSVVQTEPVTREWTLE